jgi:hypothetical protein
MEMEGEQRTQIDVGQAVAVGDQEAFAETVEAAQHTRSGGGVLAAVDDLHAPARRQGQGEVGEGLVLEPGRQHELRQPLRGVQLEDVQQDRPVGDFEQRLGELERVRIGTRAATPAQDQAPHAPMFVDFSGTGRFP